MGNKSGGRYIETDPRAITRDQDEGSGPIASSGRVAAPGARRGPWKIILHPKGREAGPVSVCSTRGSLPMGLVRVPPSSSDLKLRQASRLDVTELSAVAKEDRRDEYPGYGYSWIMGYPSRTLAAGYRRNYALRTSSMVGRPYISGSGSEPLLDLNGGSECAPYTLSYLEADPRYRQPSRIRVHLGSRSAHIPMVSLTWSMN